MCEEDLLGCVDGCSALAELHGRIQRYWYGFYTVLGQYGDL